MVVHRELESAARDLMRREWYRFSEMNYATPGNGSLDDCPMLPLLPDLLQLMDEARGQPLETLAPLVRQMLVEQNFHDGNGDRVIAGDIEDTLDREVGMIVGVLEQLRMTGVAEGEWSPAPVTPIMFG